ncbi:nucleolar protein 12 [Agrilus planipennis]|uniref:Nucleolar protein 12 n=1 Tax=Agrilus planipennis TaxID=224129 RepID=A0A7F5R2J6_AGRPL|nr:nucleolar protein 12 [Agrilus planipennis]
MSKPSKNSKFKSQKNRNSKVHLVFDENKRREFLCGFRKRKLQRKQKAQEELKKQLKEEKKRLKAEAKECYKTLVKSYKPVPEVEHLLLQEYEEDEVNVKVLELSTSEIAKHNNWIGPNCIKYEDEENEQNNIETHSEVLEEIPGMELQSKQNRATTKASKVAFSSEKDLKKTLKKQATKNIKNSKVFQKKGNIERMKQKKKALQQKKLKLKLNKKGKQDIKKNKFKHKR